MHFMTVFSWLAILTDVSDSSLFSLVFLVRDNEHPLLKKKNHLFMYFSKKQRIPFCWLTPQMPTVAKLGQDQSWELKTPFFGSPMGVVGTQILVPSSLPPKCAGIQSGARTQTQAVQCGVQASQTRSSLLKETPSQISFPV